LNVKKKEGYSFPVDAPPFTEKPWYYKNDQEMQIYYRTDPKNVKTVLPELDPPLEPDPDGLCGVWISYKEMVYGFGTGFGEAVVGEMVRFQGVRGYYVSHVFVTSDVALIAGREADGVPKRIAEITLNKIGELITGSCVRDGIKIISATMKANEPAKPEELPPVFPAWMLKVIPSVEGSIAIKRLVSPAVEDIVIKELWKGSGTVSFEQSVIAPFAVLKPEEIVKAFWLVQDFTEKNGKIIYDFLKK